VALGRVLIFAPGLGVIGLFIAMLADEGLRSLLNGSRFLLRLRRERRLSAAIRTGEGEPAALA
jgi:hypothetical protein